MATGKWARAAKKKKKKFFLAAAAAVAGLSFILLPPFPTPLLGARAMCVKMEFTFPATSARPTMRHNLRKFHNGAQRPYQRYFPQQQRATKRHPPRQQLMENMARITWRLMRRKLPIQTIIQMANCMRNIRNSFVSRRDRTQAPLNVWKALRNNSLTTLEQSAKDQSHASLLNVAKIWGRWS
jgi:hypothetical protein